MSRRRRDEGFTLPELVIVLSLFTFVLAAAWATYQLVSHGSDMSNRRAFASQEIGNPLNLLEKILGQSQDFVVTDGIGPYRVAVRADVDDDQIPEDYIFEATSDGLLTLRRREGTAAFVTVVLSEHNANVATGRPLFRYYKINEDTREPELITGTDIATLSANIWAFAHSMDITIVCNYEGEELSGTRSVLLRNR